MRTARRPARMDRQGLMWTLPEAQTGSACGPTSASCQTRDRRPGESAASLRSAALPPRRRLREPQLVALPRSDPSGFGQRSSADRWRNRSSGVAASGVSANNAVLAGPETETASNTATWPQRLRVGQISFHRIVRRFLRDGNIMRMVLPHRRSRDPQESAFCPQLLDGLDTEIPHPGPQATNQLV